MAKKPSEMTVEELDQEITKRGDQIAALRKEQRPFLKAKDKIVLKETESIRADGMQNLGANDNG